MTQDDLGALIGVGGLVHIVIKPHVEYPILLFSQQCLLPLKLLSLGLGFGLNVLGLGTEHGPKSPAGQRANCQQASGITKTESEIIKMSSRTVRWSGGEPFVKTNVATRRDYDHLGRALAGEAFGRGFNKATSKAFMGDGLKVNWSVWSTHF